MNTRSLGEYLSEFVDGNCWGSGVVKSHGIWAHWAQVLYGVNLVFFTKTLEFLEMMNMDYTLTDFAVKLAML